MTKWQDFFWFLGRQRGLGLELILKKVTVGKTDKEMRI